MKNRFPCVQRNPFFNTIRILAGFSGLSANITAVGSWVGSHCKGNDVELVAYRAGDIFLGSVVGQLSSLQIGISSLRIDLLIIMISLF